MEGLKMENKKRLIDANALVERLKFKRKISELGLFRGLESAIAQVEKAPTVDAVEVVHARKAESAISKTGLMCTACYSDIDRDAVFCKYCGAKMDGDKDSNLLFADMEEIIDATD